MGISIHFRVIIDGDQGSESAGLAGAGSAKFAFLGLLVYGINCKCFQQRSLVYTWTVLTQKENWIWIAAFVTNEVDVEGIPTSGEVRGSPSSHIHTPTSLKLTEWGNNISIGYRPVNLIPLSQAPPFHHSAFQLGIVMPQVSNAICIYIYTLFSNPSPWELD